MSDQSNSLGMDEKTASWFAYVISIISAIILLVTEKNNRTVRLHAWQSLFLGCTIAAIAIILAILSAIFFWISWGILILFNVIGWLAWVGFIVLTVICIIKATQNDIFKLPVIYGWAEKMK